VGSRARESALQLGWDPVVRQLETLLEIAACVTPMSGDPETAHNVSPTV
jgi:hypothetical protein